PARFELPVLFAVPLAFILAAMNPRSAIRRALVGSGDFPMDKQRIYARNFEVPAGGGVGTARAIARAYSAFATGGAEIGVTQATLLQLMAPAVPPSGGLRDGALKAEIPFS